MLTDQDYADIRLALRIIRQCTDDVESAIGQPGEVSYPGIACERLDSIEFWIKELRNAATPTAANEGNV